MKSNLESLKQKIQELEKEHKEGLRIKKELTEKQSLLKQQNINIVKKSIELSDIKRELEDKNYELENIRRQLKEENITLVRKSIELSSVMRDFEDKNYDLELTQKNLHETITALQKSEERFRELAELLPQSVFEINMEGYFIYSNRFGLETFGYTQEELKQGVHALQLFAPEDRKRVQKNIEKRLKNIDFDDHEYTCVRKDGSFFPVLLYTSVIISNNRPVGVRGILLDITSRKQMEEGLRESEERYRDLFESASDLIQSVSPEGKFLFVNKAWKETLGYNDEEIASLNLFEIIHPECLDSCRALFQRIISGEKIDKVEATFVSKEGKKVIVEGSVNFRFKDGKPLSTRGIFRDITERKRTEDELKKYQEHLEELVEKRTAKIKAESTERKRAEKALRDSEERLQLYFSNINDLIFSVDSNSTILNVSPSVERILGYKPEDLIGKTFNELSFLTPLSMQKAFGDIALLFKGKSIENSEYEFITKNGKRLFGEISASPIYSEGKIIATVAIARDITERKKLEEELQKAAKLESIGILAGGIAHDFNNLLTAIIANISLVLIDTNPESNTYQMLIDIDKAALRAKELTQQLLTFSKGGMPVKKLTSITGIIKESVRFALRGSNVKCNFSIPNNLWPVEIDEGQISQAISNLIINADQAMPKGGDILIVASNIVIKAEHKLPLKDGIYIKLSIQDQGVGISAEHLSSIFDPYFTTKQKGSGLGLSTAYSIIKKHEGYITVESMLNEGTTFHVFLPASAKKVESENVITEKLFAGKGKVLVMDDEEIIRLAAKNLLKRFGFETAFARDGIEAIELYKEALEAKKPFSFVIIDLTIPGGLGGKDTIAKLLEIDPRIKAIVSSGYSNDPIMANYKKYGFIGFLAKPYKVYDLSRVLNEIFEEDV